MRSLFQLMNFLCGYMRPLKVQELSIVFKFQSQIYPVAFKQDENLLVCAPTGSGKTNVAMLCILNEIGKNRDEETGIIDTEAFKIVYIAPMKALVQEMVGNFSTRLKSYGIKVSEFASSQYRKLRKRKL